MVDDTDRTTLYLLAAHAAGDWPFQSNRMARDKLENASVRASHVTTYCLSFLPVVFMIDWNKRQIGVFFTSIWISHFAIDSRRWAHSTEQFPTRSIWFDQILPCFAVD